MKSYSETSQPSTEHLDQRWILRPKRLVASLAFFASTLAAAGCGVTGGQVAEAKGPTASPWSSSTRQTYPPFQSFPTTNPRAEVFLRGIAALPNDIELDTIVDRLCRLRQEDTKAPLRTTASPNSDEISSLERGYDQLYADTNGLPGPSNGGEQWAIREEAKQCPQSVPRTPGR
jgi:hypothetical protein